KKLRARANVRKPRYHLYGRNPDSGPQEDHRNPVGCELARARNAPASGRPRNTVGCELARALNTPASRLRMRLRGGGLPMHLQAKRPTDAPVRRGRTYTRCGNVAPSNQVPSTYVVV